jgi:oxygen-independent coproporphyrinogen-3 oxidase
VSERGLYVHIPFCRRKCHYCNYTIWVGAGEEDRERFFRALAAEAVRAAERYGPLAFDTLYFGGGTPSLLLADEFRRVAEILRKHFRFRPGAEFTCEANPGDVDATRLAAWRREGMNRVSLGIQSFDDHLLRLMGRAHDRAAALEAVRALGGAGFDNVSFDLILRLPGQTPAGAREALEEAVRLGPRQVVLYDLNVHEGTVFGRRAREGKLDLPSEALHEAMFAAAEEVLVRRAGFRHYEVSTFARPGYEARHNLIYWRNGEYLGLGPGAFSYMQGVRYQFAPATRRTTKRTALRRRRSRWRPS